MSKERVLKKLVSKQGSALALVLVSFVLLLILLSSGLTLISFTRTNYYNKSKKNQARLTATNVVESIWEMVYNQMITDTDLGSYCAGQGGTGAGTKFKLDTTYLSKAYPGIASVASGNPESDNQTVVEFSIKGATDPETCRQVKAGEEITTGDNPVLSVAATTTIGDETVTVDSQYTYVPETPRTNPSGFMLAYSRNGGNTAEIDIGQVLPGTPDPDDNYFFIGRPAHAGTTGAATGEADVWSNIVFMGVDAKLRDDQFHGCDIIFGDDARFVDDMSNTANKIFLGANGVYFLDGSSFEVANSSESVSLKKDDPDPLKNNPDFFYDIAERNVSISSGTRGGRYSDYFKSNAYYEDRRAWSSAPNAGKVGSRTDAATIQNKFLTYADVVQKAKDELNNKLKDQATFLDSYGLKLDGGKVVPVSAGSPTSLDVFRGGNINLRNELDNHGASYFEIIPGTGSEVSAPVEIDISGIGRRVYIFVRGNISFKSDSYIALVGGETLDPKDYPVFVLDPKVNIYITSISGTEDRQNCGIISVEHYNINLGSLGKNGSNGSTFGSDVVAASTVKPPCIIVGAKDNEIHAKGGTTYCDAYIDFYGDGSQVLADSSKFYGRISAGYVGHTSGNNFCLPYCPSLEGGSSVPSGIVVISTRYQPPYIIY